VLSKILNIFGIHPKKLVPLSAADIVQRSREANHVLEWSRGKKLTIFNPPFWGIHHIFIDHKLQHGMICVKQDHSAFVFYGNAYGPYRWEKYDDDLNVIDRGFIETQELTWLIYQDYIIYNGPMLPATNKPYHWGRVIHVDSFSEEIDKTWALHIIPYIKETANDCQ
jgi:hypothetical protein